MTSMSRRLILELPNDVYARVEAAAAATNQSPEEWVATSLPQLLPPPPTNGAANGALAADWFEALQRQLAAESGETVEELRARWDREFGPKPRPVLTHEEREAANRRLAALIGSVYEPGAVGADNDSIDADLAREYGSTHDEVA
jgi:hypothetical protein